MELGNQIVEEGEFLFIEVFQLIYIIEKFEQIIIVLHPYKLMDLGIEDQQLLTPQNDFMCLLIKNTTT